MPDPSWAAQQQAQQAARQAQQIHRNHVRIHQHAHDMARVHGSSSRTHRPVAHTGGGRGGGLGGFLTFLIVVAVVVCVVRDPGLRDDVTTFARDLLTRVQNS